MKGYKPDINNKELASKSAYLELGDIQHDGNCECDVCKENK